MPLIAWINEVFPPDLAPFTAPEILSRLQNLYSPRITKSAVYRAIEALEQRSSTAAIVAPLDNARPAHYSAEAARRIARQVTRCKPPKRAENSQNDAKQAKK